MILTENNIVKQISENLSSLKLPTDMKIFFVDKYVFPDGFEIVASSREKISILAHNGEGIGIFQFSAKKVIVSGSKSNYATEPITITLDFVQGIKKLTDGVPFPKGWQEVIVNSFILSTLPVLENNPELKVRYGEFIPFKFGEDRNLDRKKIIKELIREYDKIKSISPRNPRLFMLKYQILTLQNKIRFVNSIRDRYFDKEGFLNPKKERVKQIFKTYAKNKDPSNHSYQRPKPKQVKKKTPVVKRRR